MLNNTTIQISRENKKELDKLKLCSSETYNEIISRLLKIAEEEHHH